MKSGSPSTPTYRDFLYEEFKKRRDKNSSYSLRAFARDLEINPSRLSEIMNGKVGLSDTKGAELADRFGLAPKEREYFLDLIRAEHARSSLAKREARERVRKYLLEGRTLTESEMNVASDWRCLAALELIGIPEIQTTIEGFANLLVLPAHEVEAVIHRLSMAGRIDTTQARWTLKPSEDVPTDVLGTKTFHSQMLKRARRSIHQDPHHENEFSSMIFAMSAAQMSYAKDRLREFHANLINELQAMPGKDKVYGLSLQLFEVKGDAD